MSQGSFPGAHKEPLLWLLQGKQPSWPAWHPCAVAALLSGPGRGSFRAEGSFLGEGQLRIPPTQAHPSGVDYTNPGRVWDPDVRPQGQRWGWGLPHLAPTHNPPTHQPEAWSDGRGQPSGAARREVEEPWLRAGGNPGGEPGKAREGGQGQHPSSALAPRLLPELCRALAFYNEDRCLCLCLRLPAPLQAEWEEKGREPECSQPLDSSECCQGTESELRVRACSGGGEWAGSSPQLLKPGPAKEADHDC